ncbi:hypothetical protein P7K49_021242 [Saguinus oedipus]|uniref:Uncharacterized protein n=1 Tax=Saguinus oedipus TaxID=9490 RepID=A0ABQ9USV1_SAGOE|nr:hypothetical protein P7K49_021242 [Saguinus oedipus]
MLAHRLGNRALLVGGGYAPDTCVSAASRKCCHSCGGLMGRETQKSPVNIEWAGMRLSKSKHSAPDEGPGLVGNVSKIRGLADVPPERCTASLWLEPVCLGVLSSSKHQLSVRSCATLQGALFECQPMAHDGGGEGRGLEALGPPSQVVDGACKDASSGDGESLDEDSEFTLASDFEIGHFFRERIVPRAVLYFTGEAIEDDDNV